MQRGGSHAAGRVDWIYEIRIAVDAPAREEERLADAEFSVKAKDP